MTSSVLRSPSIFKVGQRTRRTPIKPKATVVRRKARTVSPKINAAKTVRIKGVVKPRAATSGKLSTPRAKNRKDIEKAPARPRHVWSKIFDVRSAFGKSPRIESHPITTKSVKNARKKTCCPVGTSWDVALISAIIKVNIETAVTFSAMPRMLSVISVQSDLFDCNLCGLLQLRKLQNAAIDKFVNFAEFYKERCGLPIKALSRNNITFTHTHL